MKKSLLLLLCVFLANITFSQNQASQTIVIHPCYFDVSPPLRDMVQIPFVANTAWKDGVVKNKFNYDDKNYDPYATDQIRQTWFGGLVPDTTIQNFNGVSGDGSLVPPDTDGDVGPNHYMQVVNCKYAVYSKTGTTLVGPAANSTIFQGLPNNSNDGDAVICYDEVADRWLFSQFSLPNYPNGPFYEMVAISQTPDPTGSWYRYQFQFADMPDYPKISVWPDAYYMTIRRFASGSGSWLGPASVAMDRTKMIAGDPSATMVMKTLPSSYDHFLPADCDGAFPPAGTPCPHFVVKDNVDRMDVYDFHVDFINTTNSTLTQVQQIPLTPFSGGISGGIPQKGTSVKLDAQSGHLMFRLPFRKFATHWSLAACFTVNVGSSVAGIRWYEFRKTGSNPWAIYQEGTYSPDNNCRWMGSIAMDTAGNMALGYSISSTSMFPSVRYTGRMANDPLNQMTIAEGGIVNGGGYQSNTWSGNPSRWGDYSSMNVDPAAPATFWYTQEYYQTTSQASWKTRIGSFSFFNIFTMNATATPDTICIGQSSQLQANATGGSGTYTYAWTSIPAGFTSNQPNPVVSPLVTTKYIATVGEGTQTIVDTAYVFVAEEPTALAGNDTSYCIEWPLWPVQGNAEFASAIHWETLGDGTINNDTLLYILYTPGPGDKAAGQVTLKLTAYPVGTCTTPDEDDVHITLTPCTGINEIKADVFGMVLTPNPTTGLFTVSVGGVMNQSVIITVTDLKGTQIINKTISSGASILNENLDLTKYSKGIYVVKVTTGNKSATEKLVVK